MEQPVKVVRVDKLCVAADAVCELDAPDHRGEIYEFSFALAAGRRVRVVLCRHHVRTLRQVLVEV